MARKVMDDLLNRGRVVRGWLGVQIQSLDDDLAASMGLDSRHGVIVNDLTAGGPAEKAGFKHGDVMLEFNGKEVKDADHLQSLVAAQDPGSPVKVKVRRDKKDVTLTVDLGERPANPREAFNRGENEGTPNRQAPAATAPQLGIEIQSLTPGLAQELGYEGDAGVVVERVARSGPAATKNIRAGDLIKEVNRKEVPSVEAFNNVMKDVESGQTVLLLLRRGDTTFFTAVKVSEQESK